MPELPVKEVRLPELHLPEIDRDQIVSSLSGLRLPAIEIPTLERPRFGRRARFGGFDPRAIDWRALDLGPAIAGATALVRVGSRARPLVRTRWAVAAGVVVVIGVATAALVATPAVRERAGRTVRGVRARMDGGATDQLDVEADLAAIDDDADEVETVIGDAVEAVADAEADAEAATEAAVSEVTSTT